MSKDTSSTATVAPKALRMFLAAIAVVPARRSAAGPETTE
jgi:hypothetical protein